MMLIVSICALLAYGAVFIRGGIFALSSADRRQADHTEVGFMMVNSGIYVLVMICLWLFEPWKMTNNSPWSAAFVGVTIVNAGYFFRRMEALTIGRERRGQARRGEDDGGHRTRRPPA